ncbi:MAG: sulfatase-like hydrolase/transferase [candidate division KSB1 bacterium]|nr:sulfatase-like hydrolase/transferase [candidate division KSB1 bacterium]
MNRRDFVNATLAAGGTLALLTKVYAQPEKPRQQPNIVLIIADDLGFETIGCYGAKDYKTPNIDALAAKGVRFNHCYSQPLCTPSRVQIMTGRYNNRNYEGFGYLNPKEITFGNILKKTGYQTCIAGKWQLCGDASTIKAFGFDEHCLWNMHAYREDAPDAKEPKGWLRRYDAPTLYENGKWIEHPEGVYGPQVCADFIRSFIKKNKDQPFFVYYPMILTHDPFVPTPDSINKNSKDNKKKNFVDMVEYMDLLVGQIVNQLEEQGILDNTLVLFTGDNGTHRSITSETTRGRIKGGKAQMTDAGTRVPLIACWSGKSPAGTVLEDLVDFSDFLPTVREAAGSAVPADRIIDGRTFLPQILGRKGKPREWIFCHYWGRGRNKEQTREFVRDQRWKLYDNGQMYDIKNDVLEQSPLQDTEPKLVAVRKRLQAAFEAVRKR